MHILRLNFQMAAAGANHMVKWADKVYCDLPNYAHSSAFISIPTLLLRHAFNISMLKVFKVTVKEAHVQDVARSR
jgi:hypothetical protein